MKRATRVRIHTDQGWKTIFGWLTCSKHFVIHPTFNRSFLSQYPRYTLTHVKTGYAVARAEHTKVLRLLAGVFGALPVPWQQLRGPKQTALLKIEWLKIPQSIRTWREVHWNL